MAYSGNHRLGELFKNRRERGEPGLPTLSVTLNDGLVDRDSLGRKTDTTLNDEAHLLVRKGDIAYNMMRMWQGASGLAEKDGLVSPAYVVLAPKAKIDSRYASYLFKSQRMIYLFWAYSYGLTSDRLRLYFGDFAKIPAMVLPAKEQAKVAVILSTWERAIRTTGALVENARAQEKALLDKLFAGASKSWKVSTLGELAMFKSGGTPSRQERGFWGGTNTWVSAKDLKRHYVDTSLETLTDAGFAAANIAPRGSTLVLVRGMTLMKNFPIGFATKDVAFNQDLKALVPRAHVDPLFLSYALVAKKNLIRDLVSTAGHGTGKLETEQLKAFRIMLPPLHEQRKIAKALNAGSQVVERIERQLAMLRAEKCVLMQQLLAGKRRVKLDSAA